MGTTYLLVNPRAGVTARSANDFVAAMRARGVQPVVLHPGSRDEAVDMCEKVAKESEARLVVAGGDGTVHIAVNAVAGTSTVFGLLPIGSGNDFARALGLTRPRRAIDEMVAAALSPPLSVDLLTSTYGYAATVVAAGFPARVNERAESMHLPRFLNRVRYLTATVAEIRRLRAIGISLVVDGEEQTVEATILAMANTRYFGNGLDVCPGADPTDGLMDLCIVGPVRRRELLRVLPGVFRGRHVGHPAVTMLRAREVTIGGEGVVVRADGESFTTSPLTISVAPGALQLAGVLQEQGVRK